MLKYKGTQEIMPHPQAAGPEPLQKPLLNWLTTFYTQKPHFHLLWHREIEKSTEQAGYSKKRYEAIIGGSWWKF